MQYLAFNPVLPYGENPEPVVYENGKPVLRLYEKGAQRVTLTVAEKEYPFAKSSEQEDVFTLQLPFATGINYVQIAVDGREVLTPLLPIGYGYSRPYNYIELRTPDDDWYQLRDVPHGCVHVEHFFSKVTGEWERCTIYTPPSFDEHPEKTYPVLYLQHGHGENETGWIATGRANLILDNLIAAGKAVPFVMVMNNGMVQKKNDAAPCGHVVDHLLFEPMLLQDVIPFVESKYHCGGKKALRGMAGLGIRADLHAGLPAPGDVFGGRNLQRIPAGLDQRQCAGRHGPQGVCESASGGASRRSRIPEAVSHILPRHRRPRPLTGAFPRG